MNITNMSYRRTIVTAEGKGIPINAMKTYSRSRGKVSCSLDTGEK
jgi:hypothetical protein